MKKYAISSFLLLCTSVSIFSQTQKGDWMLGGDLGFHQSNGATTNFFQWSFRPSPGYFFTNRLAAGSGFSIGSGRASNGTTTSAFGLSPFLRYYFSDKKWRPFAQADFNYFQSKIHFKNAPIPGVHDFKTSQSLHYLHLGMDYFLSPNVAL